MRIVILTGMSWILIFNLGCMKAAAKHVFRLTGIEVHVHLFRHIAAKMYLDAHPGAYEVVRRVLGHKSMDTTTEAYTGLESAAAGRHFDNTILALRERTAFAGRWRRRPKREIER